VIPAELFFGPAAAARVAAPPPPIFQPPVIAPVNGAVNGVPPLRVDPQVNAARQAPEKERFSNAAARERAARFMEFGDRHFARGDYLQAYERYKLAVEAAPDLVEPFLRRGQALVALGNYTLAGQTFIHAFKMHPAWFRTDFRLDRIYGDRRQAKLTHLDALAEAAEKQPTAELMLLIAAQLFYDGQAERSLRFFERAKELNRGAAVELPPAELPAAQRPAPEQKAKQPDPAVF
jgi:tetratricopeptide (TPR) repeat protein